MSLLVPGEILSSLFGFPFKEAAKVGLSAVSGWMVAGAEAVLREVVTVIGLVTTPSLSASWFSGTYWKVSALAMLLTLPFLFAAAVQAIVQTDLNVLLRAACFDLPVATLSVTLAAPLITLLLAATDEMCRLVTGGGPVGGSFLTVTATDLSSAGSGFMLVIIAVVILLAGLALAVEMIVRSAAIYVVVLFLPLGFAAMVWPARRVWIKRMLELLIALILSKFAMVAILSLAVAGLASVTTTPSPVTTALTAMALMVLAVASPWALLRLLPFTEIAAGHVGRVSHDVPRELDDAMARRRRAGATAADATAGMTVDPVMDGVNAVHRFVSSGAGFGSGGRGQDTEPAMAVLHPGGGSEPSGEPPADPAPGGRGPGGGGSGGPRGGGSVGPGDTGPLRGGSPGGEGSAGPAGAGGGTSPAVMWLPAGTGAAGTAAPTGPGGRGLTPDVEAPPQRDAPSAGTSPDEPAGAGPGERSGAGAGPLAAHSLGLDLPGSRLRPAPQGPVEDVSEFFVPDRERPNDDWSVLNLNPDGRGWLLTAEDESPVAAPDAEAQP